MHHGRDKMLVADFYKNKKVLVTGHTGFKGSWLSHLLRHLNSEVYGYSLEPPTNPSLFELSDVESFTNTCIGDICDYDRLFDYYSDVKPDVVIHMAAQPLVRDGYRHPRETYLTNVIGTVNIMECARQMCTKSVLNVTTDKVYDNINDIEKKYKETDPLDGSDPYSNSKSCSELVTHSYVRSYPKEMGAVSTARAGNVIGGGDFSSERIIPDCVRAAQTNSVIKLRNPNSIRPYQHVLEPLYSYLVIAAKQSSNNSFAGSYNIAPELDDCVTTGELASLFCENWGNSLKWTSVVEDGPHEANYLKLDNTRLKSIFGIFPMWNIHTAVSKVVEWTRVWINEGDIVKCMDNQISDYLSGRSME